ncbi:GRIP and coiled-coil domain-containing protein 1 isoform X4 [Hydra vulgaris]|uniref:GRIP and coiled-coil domain-containing protein 1 isoform X4 n=2 Tax=Hydra vulgaris TaxID=6087 RepID=A0ABM4BF38_HYDVU
MEKFSKNELIKSCEKYQSKLQRYEIRFAALVDAYKNLTEEKNVLESTLKTLSAKPSPKKCLKSSTASNFSDPLGVSSDNLNGSSDNTIEDEATQDITEEKIAALSSALQSVTEAKAKMEASFQADKKLTLAEHTNRLSEVELETQKAYNQVNELKLKLRTEQQEREKEQEVYNSMLKELQSLLNVEKLEKDQLRMQLSEVNTTLKKSQKQVCDCEEKIQKLTVDFKNIQSKEDNAGDSTLKNTLNDLAKQLELIKKEKAEDLSVEKQRANKAEDMLKLRQQLDEKRIAELELRISELSEVVGNYDQLHQQDQQIICQLRERLETLNDKNPSCLNDEKKIIELEEQIVKLKNLLKSSTVKSQTEILDIEDNFKEDTKLLLCQTEYKQLKDEFELYKKKQCLSSHPSKDKNDELSQKIVEYKKKIDYLESNNEQLVLKNNLEEKEHLRIVSTLQIQFTKLEEDCLQKIEQLKVEHLKNIELIENELKKQRIRTLDLLAEKDIEIDRLREKQYENEYLLQQTPKSQEVFKFPEFKEKSVIDEMLQNSPTMSPTKRAAMVHYTELLEQQRIDLSSYRAQLEDVKNALKDSERREDQLVQQMNLLKEEIRSLERSRSRESANLEYLKNICLQYMLSDCPSKRKQMARAIATILYFSPSEIATIDTQLKNGW